MSVTMDVFVMTLDPNLSFKKHELKMTILSFLTICVLFAFVKLIKSSTESSLIPNLPSLPLIGPFHSVLWEKDPSKLFQSWLSLYGSTFKTNILGTELVLLSNPKWLQKFLLSSDPGHLSKYPLFYNIFFPNVFSLGLIPQPNVPKWKQHRSVLSRAFSLESLKTDLKVMNRHAKQLFHKLDEIKFEDNVSILTAANESNTLLENLRQSASRTIRELFCGPNNLTKVEELEFDKTFARRQDIIAHRLERPWCLVEAIWNFLPEKKEMDILINSISATFTKLANRARENVKTEKSTKTIMDLMIKGGFENEEIVSELGSFVTAVHDTQTSSLNVFLFVLAWHSTHQAECRSEIDKIFDSKSKDVDALNDELCWNDLSQMKYLEMCINESLRMFTPTPAIARELKTHLKLEEDLVLHKGTVVIVCTALIHRDPQVYPDPNSFNPDRFLPENCKARSAYSYLPFSKGLRGCIGQKMSMMHMKILVAYILRNYELYPGNPDYNLDNVWETTIWRTKDLGVRWKKRT